MFYLINLITRVILNIRLEIRSKILEVKGASYIFISLIKATIVLFIIS